VSDPKGLTNLATAKKASLNKNPKTVRIEVEELEGVSDMAFMPNSSLIIIPPLLFGGLTIAERVMPTLELLNGETLKSCICGVFQRRADKPLDYDHIYMAVRPDAEDAQLIKSMINHPLYVNHYRGVLGNINYIIIVYSKRGLLKHVDELLKDKPLSCLGKPMFEHIKQYWHGLTNIEMIDEYINYEGRYSMYKDIMPKCVTYAYAGIEDKRYLNREIIFI
jgi:hypothetical protein